MASWLSFLHSRSAARVAGGLLAATVVTSAALAKRSVEPVPEPVLPPASEALAGSIRAGDVVDVSTPVPVAIADAVVAVGDQVQAGDPIARIDVTAATRELEERRLDVARARQDVVGRTQMVTHLEREIRRLTQGTSDAPAQLALAERDAQQVPMRQARDSPERAQVAYDQARLRATRLEQLFERGLVSKQDVEDGHFAVKYAEDDLANARLAADAAANLRAVQGAAGKAARARELNDQNARLAEQQAALEQAKFAQTAAEMRLDAANAAIADACIRAPRAGVVLDLAVHAGERVAAGALVARIAPLDPMTVEVDVPAAMVNLLTAGDTARVDVPPAALSDAAARIRSIAPLPGDDGRYTVRLTLPNPSRLKLSGMTAHVRLPIRPRLEHP